MRTHNQTRESISHGYTQFNLNQSHKHFQNSSDENKPPPAKIPNTKSSPSHSSRASYLPTGRILVPTSAPITTSTKPSFVIHQDALSPRENLQVAATGFSFDTKNVENTLQEAMSVENKSNLPTISKGMDTSNGIATSKGLHPMTADFTNTSIEQILSRTSAAEFRNSCNDSIQSTSSPATDLYDRDSDVYSLLQQHNDLLENEAPMEDDTTIQEISGTSEEEEPEQITKPPQPVSESVLVSDEYSADILAHVKRTEV